MPQSTAEALRYLSEKTRVAAHKPNVLNYQPHNKQKLFHSSTAYGRLFIGGNRSGKTTAGVVEDIFWARGKHPYRVTPDGGVRGRVVGVDFDRGVEKILLPEFARWTPISELRGNSWTSAYDRQLRTLYFENGSFVEFMSYEQDLDKFAGTSRHFVHFDEEPPEDIWTECLARLIDTGGSWWITMTPVEGMTWIYDKIYIPGHKDPLSGYYITEVLMTENPHLGSAEVEQYISTLTEDEKESRIRGKFVQRGGLIYPMFDPEKHVIEPVLPVGDQFLIIQSLDHGFTNPTAALWGAADHEGNLIIFAEHYLAGHTVDYHAKSILAREAEFKRSADVRVADPSIRNTDSITGTSVQQEYSSYGVHFTLANNDVGAGLVRVARYFNTPGKLKITNNCSNLVEELLRYRWATFASKKVGADHNLKETPHKKNDHAADSLRYMIMSRPDLAADTPLPVGALPIVGGVSLTASDYDESLRQSTSPPQTVWQSDEEYGGLEWG